MNNHEVLMLVSPSLWRSAHDQTLHYASNLSHQ